MISIHVDVDNLWVYEEEYRTLADLPYERVYDQALPLLLEAFARFGVKATFFVVGRDFDMQECRDFCRRAVADGHELANHTDTHPVNLHRLGWAEKEAEIRRCGERIAEVTGKKPIGFRAPGYYLDEDIIEILIGNGYVYDASVLPSLLTPLMWYYIVLRGGLPLDKAFGRLRHGFCSQRVLRVPSRTRPGESIYEVPISTVPLFRTPFHSTFVYALGLRYFSLARSLLRLFPGNRVYLFHAVDALDYPKDGALRAKLLPLKWSLPRRLELVGRILSELGAIDRFVNTGEWLSRRPALDPPASWLL